MPGALVDAKPLFCTPNGLFINMEDETLFGGVVVGLAVTVEGPKRVSRSSIPDDVFWADEALSSKSIKDSSFLVDVEASS